METHSLFFSHLLKHFLIVNWSAFGARRSFVIHAGIGKMRMKLLHEEKEEEKWEVRKGNK